MIVTVQGRIMRSFSIEEYREARMWSGKPLNVFTEQKFRENISGIGDHVGKARIGALMLILRWRKAHPQHPTTQALEAEVASMHVPTEPHLHAVK
jgi:hypothetical protein